MINLFTRLDKQKDYPQIKKELGILRTLEFSSQDNTALDSDQSEVNYSDILKAKIFVFCKDAVL